jgi:hypothetical protein
MENTTMPNRRMLVASLAFAAAFVNAGRAPILCCHPDQSIYWN